MIKSYFSLLWPVHGVSLACRRGKVGIDWSNRSPVYWIVTNDLQNV